LGLYDRDYYKERQKGKRNLSRLVFKAAWWLIAFLFLVAFVVWVLAIFSEK
jgi:cell division septal protein FtsQ